MKLSSYGKISTIFFQVTFVGHIQVADFAVQQQGDDVEVAVGHRVVQCAVLLN